MKRAHSELFAPYRFLGVVTGEVEPSVRSVFVGKKATLSILCPVDNVVLHYNGKKLRQIGASNPFPEKVTAVASSSSCVFAAHGQKISAMPFCRDVKSSICTQAPIRMMVVIGDQLIAVDINSGIQVIDTITFTPCLYMEGGPEFQISSIVHPSTYLNKVLVGSAGGRVRLINIRTGKVVHEFQRDFGSDVTVLKQTTALDVVSVGLKSGKVLLYNIKLDKILHSFSHDAQITSIAFRDDGESSMVTADRNGTIAVWSLEKQELVGKLTGSHSDVINCLYFLPGEPIMISASADNSLRLWIFDGADGMPRELVRAQGHSLPAAAVHFLGKNEVLSAGNDGSIRKYDVTSLTFRQKLGSIAPVSPNPQQSVTANPVVEMAVGWQREAAWNNVFCRQKTDTRVTSWQTRNNTQGSFTLQHDRFKTNVDYVDANSTALCLSPCGNFVFIGYSTGHIDQFNAQSGRHVHTFSSKRTSHSSKSSKKGISRSKLPKSEDFPAFSTEVTSLSIDKRGKELMSTDAEGSITFWSLSTRRITGKISKKEVTLGKSASNPINSLIALVTVLENGRSVVVLIDSVCHRPVREFINVGEKVNALAFSSDGKWLLVADNDSYIRVFDISTSHLVDVLLFSKPCVSLSFNETGEFLATVHAGERAVYIWANKAVFLSHVNVRALDANYLPTWGSRSDAPDVCIDDDDETVLDDEIRDSRENQIDAKLITFSGLPPSRWANMPDLALIKDRNRPTESIKKIKQAPFFLSAAQTLDGFDFNSEELDENSSSRYVQSKRNLLELEGSFSSQLKLSKTNEDLLDAFQFLQEKGVSYIDFQIRSLTSSTIPTFLRMLLEVLNSRKYFELVQSYLTTATKIHREYIWQDSIGYEDLNTVLGELELAQEKHWNEVEMLFVENMSIVQWIKNALL